MGIGAIPDSHPLSLRWLGMHGTVYANYAANECDLLLAFGARFDDRVTGNPKSFAVGAKIVHVDIDDSEINKNKPADLGVLADIREVLTKLNEAPEPQEYAEWFARIREWKKKYPFHYRNKPDHVQPQFVMETLSRLTRGQAVIVPRRGAAPDVGGPVLRLQLSAPAADLRRARRDGLRPARRDGRKGRLPRKDRDQHRRRRQLPDEYSGIGNAVRGGDPGQDDHPRQPAPRHGRAVGGPLLQPQPRQYRAGALQGQQRLRFRQKLRRL